MSKNPVQLIFGAPPRKDQNGKEKTEAGDCCFDFMGCYGKSASSTPGFKIAGCRAGGWDKTSCRKYYCCQGVTMESDYINRMPDGIDDRCVW